MDKLPSWLKVTKFISIQIIIVFSSTAIAWTGNDVLNLCSNKDSQICMIYVMGLSDGADEEMARALKPLSEQLKIDPFDQTMESVTKSIMSTSYCIQNGVTYQQSRDIYLKYLKDHPELRHKTAQSLYLDALKLSFPCTLSK